MNTTSSLITHWRSLRNRFGIAPTRRDAMNTVGPITLQNSLGRCDVHLKNEVFRDLNTEQIRHDEGEEHQEKGDW